MSGIAASPEDLARLRAAALQKELDGDTEGAAKLVAIHDVVSKPAPQDEDD